MIVFWRICPWPSSFMVSEVGIVHQATGSGATCLQGTHFSEDRNIYDHVWVMKFWKTISWAMISVWHLAGMHGTVHCLSLYNYANSSDVYFMTDVCVSISPSWFLSCVQSLLLAAYILYDTYSRVYPNWSPCEPNDKPQTLIYIP